MARKRETPKEQGARWMEALPLDEIEGAERNPKRHHVDLGRAIDRWGFADALIRDERTGRLVAGHGRVEVLRARHERGEAPPAGVEVDGEGRWLVPVQRGWASRSDADATAFLVAHNRLTEAGGWDPELEAVLQEIAAAEVEVPAAWSTEEFAALCLAWESADAETVGPEFAPPPAVGSDDLQPRGGEHSRMNRAGDRDVISIGRWIVAVSKAEAAEIADALDARFPDREAAAVWFVARLREVLGAV